MATDELKEKLRHAINSCSAEIDAGATPDFIVAGLLHDVLMAFGRAVHARDQWYDRVRKQERGDDAKQD